MKKTLLSLAAIATCGLAMNAQAQSAVSMYGLIDMSVGSFQTAGKQSTTAAQSGNMTTSYWGFKSSEDLGGGLKANAVAEGFLRADSGQSGRFTGDPLFARNAFVGISGGFGSIDVGRNTTSLFVNTLIFSALGDSFGFSPSIRQFFISGTVTGDTGWNESIKYSSPNMNGVSVTGHQALKGTSPGGNTGASVLYFGGPVGLGAAWQKVEKETQATTSWNLGGSYNMGAAKLFAQYGKVTNDTTKAEYTISGLGVQVPVGGGKIIGQWGQLDTAGVSGSRSTTTVAYDYNLSKRTDVYGVVMSDKAPGKSDGTTFAVGVRHAF